MSLSLLQLVLACGIAGFGAYLNGALGFGMGMVAAPLLMLIDPVFVPAPVLMVGLIVTLLGVIRDRAALDARGTGWALAGRIPGTAIGALAVAAFSARMLELAVSLSVLAGVFMSAQGLMPTRTSRTMFAAGAVSGLMSTLAAIGGPPMVLIWQGAPATQRRGALALFFTVGGVMSIGALIAVGAIDRQILLISIVLTPTVLAGYTLGALGPAFGREESARASALVLSAAAAIALLLRSLSGLFI